MEPRHGGGGRRGKTHCHSPGRAGVVRIKGGQEDAGRIRIREKRARTLRSGIVRHPRQNRGGPLEMKPAMMMTAVPANGPVVRTMITRFVHVRMQEAGAHGMGNNSLVRVVGVVMKTEAEGFQRKTQGKRRHQRPCQMAMP